MNQLHRIARGNNVSQGDLNLALEDMKHYVTGVTRHIHVHIFW